MATPSEIRTEALKTLRATQRQLNSATWVLALEDQPKEVRTEAAERRMDVQSMKLKLENQELAEIRDRLVSNEEALAAGQAKLTSALGQLNQVAKVLDAVSGFVKTLGDVLSRGGGQI